MYLSQITKGLGGDGKLAELVAKNLKDQPAEHKSAREAGYKQYWYCQADTVGGIGMSDAVRVEHEDEIDMAEYVAVKKDMVDLMDNDCQAAHLSASIQSKAEAVEPKAKRQKKKLRSLHPLRKRQKRQSSRNPKAILTMRSQES